MVYILHKKWIAKHKFSTNNNNLINSTTITHDSISSVSFSVAPLEEDCKKEKIQLFFNPLTFKSDQDAISISYTIMRISSKQVIQVMKILWEDY